MVPAVALKVPLTQLEHEVGLHRYYLYIWMRQEKRIKIPTLLCFMKKPPDVFVVKYRQKKNNILLIFDHFGSGTVKPNCQIHVLNSITLYSLNYDRRITGDTFQMKH